MFGADTRGQAIQIGAVVLFSFVVLTFSLYQATVVPDNNAEVEFNHNDEAQQDLAQLRAAVLTAATTRGGYPVPVDLGPRYPPRVVAVNPGPPSGTLTTVSYGTGQLTVANVRATDAEVRDYWSGSVSYETNGVEFQPNYNVYAEAPTTVYENSVLYNVFDSPAAGGPATVDGETVRLSSDQTLVDGKRVDLVALVGERQDSTTETVSVDPTATTVPSRTVTVQGDGGPITVSLPTNLDVDAWRALLEDEYVSNGGYVEAGTVSVSSGVVSFDLRETEGGTPVSYQLRVPAVGVGGSLPSGVAPVPTYTVAESARTVTASPGESVRLTTGVANQYNGPESGVTVEASAGGSTVDTAVTDADGEAIVTYTAPSSPGSYTVTVEADFDADGTFGEDSTETVTFTVDVTGGGGGGGDGIPPGVSGLSATPDPLTQGDDLNLAATFDDTAGRGGSDIISASWSDSRSGDSGSLGAVDGEFDQPIEDVETTIAGSVTSGWATGDHDITITGTDANGNTVSRTVTVAVQGAAGGPSLITAVEPDPQALPDSDGEFVRLQIPSGVNTTGWTLREQDDATPINRNLDGEVYLVRDEAAFESQWPVDSAKVFQYDSQIILDNAGQTVELVDDGGTVVDRFSYGDGDGGSFAGGNQFTLSGEGQVAYRMQSGGSFTDTDSASDWGQDAECDFFGGGDGCGGSPTADAGDPYSPVGEGGSTTLDGTASSDPDGDSLTYSWTITSDPAGGATLTNANTATPTFEAPDDFEGISDVTVELTVSDGNGNSDTDTATIALDEGQYEVVWDPVDETAATGDCTDAPCTDPLLFGVNTTTAAGDDETVTVSTSVSTVADPNITTVTTDGSGEAVVPVTLTGTPGVAELTVEADGNGAATSHTVVVDNEFVEDFESGLGPWETFGGSVGQSSEASSSGSTSVKIGDTDDEGGIRTGRSYDTSESDVLVIDFWAQEGNNAGIDDPDDQRNEDLRVEYLNDEGNWIQVDQLAGNGNSNEVTSYQRRILIEAADARHAGFRLRFRQPSTTYTDAWYIDDVRLAAVGGTLGDGGGTGGSDPPSVSAAAEVTYNNDGSIYDGKNSAVQFSISNGNQEVVTIERITVTTTDSGSVDLREQNGGSSTGSRDIFISASNDDGYYEAGDGGNDRYSLGTEVTLTNTASVSGSGDATFTLYRFYDGGSGGSGSYRDQRGDTVTVVIGFGDDSTKEIDVAVPN